MSAGQLAVQAQAAGSGPAPAAAAPAARWRYVPAPAVGEQTGAHAEDDHSDYERCRLEGAGGVTLIGARVRGKKHKHDGTHCDDWFEIATVGVWNLVAVADGAGSRRFSRIGARESCRAAITTLRERLGERRFEPRPWSGETFRRDDEGQFSDPQLKQVGDALASAMQDALAATDRAVAARKNSKWHYQALENRDLKPEDLACTLLIAVQTQVQSDSGSLHDLVIGCAIGDGMIAGIDKTGCNRLMMTPDSGRFSGETEFLSPHLATPAQLRRRTTVVFGSPLRALLAMTDGVADDYFPNDPGMARLYGDLAINGILPCAGAGDEEVQRALAETALADRYAVASAPIAIGGERLSAHGVEPVELLSVSAYAARLGLTLPQVLASRLLLEAARRYRRTSAADGVDDPSARLEHWLDAYQVRGSFDDRTLVALVRGEA